MTRLKKTPNAWDRIMAAITFAEADDHATARELLAPGREESRPGKRVKKRPDKRPQLRA